MGGLPADSTLLPLREGALLVSASHATFAPIPADEVRAVQQALEGAPLPPAIAGALERHGFFGPPRPAGPMEPLVQLQLTNGCNLACSYCCTDSGAPRQEELTFAQCRRVVDEAREALGAGARVSLFGGEPLLRPFAVELGHYVLDRGLGLSLHTNGLLLEREEIARGVAQLAARGALVRVSLGGATAATCDSTSGVPRFERALKGLHQLARFGPPAPVDVVVIPSQVAVLAQSLFGLRKRLPPGTQIALGVLFESGREKGDHLFRSRVELEAALDAIAFGAGELITAPKTAPVAHRREGCDCSLGQHLHVRSDGVLFTCFKMDEAVGTLERDGFAVAHARVRANARPARTLPFCSGCPLSTLCGGGCRSENLRLTGDGDVPACGPWRVRVLSELLAEGHVTALEWPAEHLLAEAHRRGLGGPATLSPPAAPRPSSRQGAPDERDTA